MDYVAYLKQPKLPAGLSLNFLTKENPFPIENCSEPSDLDVARALEIFENLIIDLAINGAGCGDLHHQDFQFSILWVGVAGVVQNVPRCSNGRIAEGRSGTLGQKERCDRLFRILNQGRIGSVVNA